MWQTSNLYSHWLVQKFSSVHFLVCFCGSSLTWICKLNVGIPLPSLVTADKLCVLPIKVTDPNKGSAKVLFYIPYNNIECRFIGLQRNPILTNNLKEMFSFFEIKVPDVTDIVPNFLKKDEQKSNHLKNKKCRGLEHQASK